MWKLTLGYQSITRVGTMDMSYVCSFFRSQRGKKVKEPNWILSMTHPHLSSSSYWVTFIQ
jgi:hypothetical protein